jgi:hypothetical protein
MQSSPPPPPPPDEFQQMVNRLNAVGGESRASVLITHLYLEYLMNVILEKQLAKPKEIVEWQFWDKLKVLDSLGILPDNVIKNLEIVNRIRNMYAHRLDIETEDFENKLCQKLQEMDWYKDLHYVEGMKGRDIYIMLIIRLYHTLRSYYRQ